MMWFPFHSIMIHYALILKIDVQGMVYRQVVENLMHIQTCLNNKYQTKYHLENQVQQAVFLKMLALIGYKTH